MKPWHTEKFKICCPLTFIYYSFHNYADVHPEGMMTGFSNNEYYVKLWDSAGNETGSILLRSRSQLKATEGDFEVIEDNSNWEDYHKDVIYKHLGEIIKIKFKNELR